FRPVVGDQGMRRICAGTGVPFEIHQRYINRMLAICYDAFGSEVSRRAQKLYDWGLKPGWSGNVADVSRVNEQVRNAFMDEARKLLALLTRLLPEAGPKLCLT